MKFNGGQDNGLRGAPWSANRFVPGTNPGVSSELYPQMPKNPQPLVPALPQQLRRTEQQAGAGSSWNMSVGKQPGGSIRQTLGSQLKRLGVFQKDGKIHNLRRGAEGLEGGNMGSGPFSFLGNGGGTPGMMQPRQLILDAAQPGIAANGIATISPDNVFSCIANLPAPTTIAGQGLAAYAVYLVDSKGQSGFLAGVLRPVGSGAYQMQFRSQVPLVHYGRVMITLENPQNLGQVPRGPVVLQVKQPLAPARFTEPIMNAGNSVWKKVSGMVRSRFGVSPTQGVVPTEAVQPGIQSPLDASARPPINPVGGPPAGF